LVRRAHGGSAVGLRAYFPFDVGTPLANAPLFRFGDVASRIYGLDHESRYQRSVSEIAATYSYPLSRRSSLFGYMGMPGDPALGPPPSYLRRFSEIIEPQTQMPVESLDSPGAISQVFTVGYVWRNLKVESSAFSSRDPEKRPVQTDSLKLDSRSSRLSFNPSPNWALQISRGYLSNLDQLMPYGEVRRTTVSATYNRAFSNANWQTTFAWGHNARRDRESTNGYLLESTFKVANRHAFFSRLEQVGSDDLLRTNESISRQAFKMNKLSIGYFHEVRGGGPVNFDVGGLISRYRVPSAMTASYGNEPTTYLVFVRMKLR
jgi:hypothetical protein